MDQERLSAAAVTAAALSLALTEARYVGCTARESTGLMEQTAHKPSRQRAQRRSCRRKGGLWDWGMPRGREAAEGDPPTDEGDELSGKAVCVAIDRISTSCREAWLGSSASHMELKWRTSAVKSDLQLESSLALLLGSRSTISCSSEREPRRALYALVMGLRRTHPSSSSSSCASMSARARACTAATPTGWYMGQLDRCCAAKREPASQVHVEDDSKLGRE
mmetsp:Transcript_44279/g.84663  ORF Transcript_44279/g.84663 Transcript_44279/m.84663 type:complete len:221 (-) Transcript_44279:181-843(-)